MFRIERINTSLYLNIGYYICILMREINKIFNLDYLIGGFHGLKFYLAGCLLSSLLLARK
jgi:hypothetical protein